MDESDTRAVRAASSGAAEATRTGAAERSQPAGHHLCTVTLTINGRARRLELDARTSPGDRVKQRTRWWGPITLDKVLPRLPMMER